VTQLAGRRALVVGGGSGIGRAVVERFLAEGASVAVLELSAAKCDELTRVSGIGPVVTGDATTWEATDASVAAATDAFGGLDTLVQCVGVFDYYRGLGQLTRQELDDGFEEIFSANVRSHLLAAHASEAALRQTRGSIIFTLSTSSYASGRGGVLYVASKFALRGAMESLADELAPDVRVNGVAPGGTLDTDLRGLRALSEETRSMADASGREDELRARTRLEVALTPEDHASSYVFLASDAARGMTGRVLHPDGGAGLPSR